MKSTNKHDTVIVKKPWGYEYLAYKNSVMGLWVLHINKGEKTSMHCHPSKTTGLVVVAGEAKINFISDNKKIVAPGKQMIRRGLFHQTHAISDVVMLEAETPVDKDDLVRLHDNYGRENSAYENSNHEMPKNKDCIWIDNPTGCEIGTYKFGDTICHVLDPNESPINKYKQNDLVMVLRGGLYKNIDGRIHEVVIPGDVGLMGVINTVAKEMDGFKEGTVLLIFNT